MNNKLFVISGLSGAGKTTIISNIMKEFPSLKKAITSTSRKPRQGEINGKDYNFFSKKEFEEMINENKFFEYAKVYGNYYGSLKKDVNNLLKKNSVIISVDVQGALTFKKKFSSSILIFIKAPLEEIRKRLELRAKDSEEVIQKRIKKAKEELFHEKEFDYVVENLSLEKAIEKVKEIIEKNI